MRKFSLDWIFFSSKKGFYKFHKWFFFLWKLRIKKHFVQKEYLKESGYKEMYRDVPFYIYLLKILKLKCKDNQKYFEKINNFKFQTELEILSQWIYFKIFKVEKKLAIYFIFFMQLNKLGLCALKFYFYSQNILLVLNFFLVKLMTGNFFNE